MDTFAEAVMRGSKAEKSLKESLYMLVEKGDAEGLLAAVYPYRFKNRFGAEAYRWLENNKGYIDYTGYREKGMFVGTGAKDCSERRVMGEGSQMDFRSITPEKAQALLSLTALRDSGRFGELVSILEEYDGVQKGRFPAMRM